MRCHFALTRSASILYLNGLFFFNGKLQTDSDGDYHQYLTAFSRTF